VSFVFNFNNKNMTKIAVIKTGGKQYKVKEKEILKVEKLPVEAGGKIKFDTLLVADGDNVTIGKPSLGEKTEGKILEHGKGKKVSVIKFKNKVRYRKNVGHRQPYTKVEIVSIAQ
jgi:large subunit ribosomal protein L21